MQSPALRRRIRPGSPSHRPAPIRRIVEPMPPALLAPDARGIACPLGGFHIDPWKPVAEAVITHAHSDHARPGMHRYWCAAPCAPLLRARVGDHAAIELIPYGERFTLGNTTLSFHPAGHVLGSAQIRVESPDEVAVAAGDYKRAHDPTCPAFEVVPCDTFITEATFALPIYRWRPGREVAHEIVTWHLAAAEERKVCVLLAYTLGKAQRLLAELAHAFDARALPRPTVLLHGAAQSMTDAYREAGVDMLPTERIAEDMRAASKDNPFAGRIVLAPPSAAGSPWMKRLGPSAGVETAFASGWMQVRGMRRRRGYDRGFVISDHADWPDLIETCAQTGAKRILCTHGSSETLARHLQEQGVDAQPLHTEYVAEGEE